MSMQTEAAAQARRRSASSPPTAPAPHPPSDTTPSPTTTNVSSKSAPATKKVHLTLQGKGGVGKSLISSLLVQYLKEAGAPVIAIDTDPVNATLVGYKALSAKRIELMEDNNVNPRKFDELMELVLAEDTNFVVDNGASTFIPLSSYLVENEAIELIGSKGKEVVVHSVVTGGQALPDTLKGLATLGRNLPPEAILVVWLNEYFGAIEADGKQFEQFNIYQELKQRIHGLVRIYRQTSATYGKDVELMLDRKLTFNEIVDSPEFGLMAKQRLANVKRAIFEQLRLVI